MRTLHSLISIPMLSFGDFSLSQPLFTNQIPSNLSLSPVYKGASLWLEPVHPTPTMFIVNLAPTSRTLLANIACFAFLIIYTFAGGVAFLWLERDHYLQIKGDLARERLECIQQLLNNGEKQPSSAVMDDGIDVGLAEKIADRCLMDLELDARKEWNLKNSLLFGFGILTTLGYGKIEPATMPAQLFAVIWGFLGVPVTVIILTNLGLYMRKAEKHVRRWWHDYRRWVEKKRRRGMKRLLSRGWRGGGPPSESTSTSSSFYYEDSEEEVLETITNEDAVDNNNIANIRERQRRRRKDERGISPSYLAALVLLYLLVGAIFIPLLNGQLELIDGLYYSYLCFTAIEYGGMIPRDIYYIPLVILYMVVGLAMSTIALGKSLFSIPVKQHSKFKMSARYT